MDKTDEVAIVEDAYLGIKSGFGKSVVSMHVLAQSSLDKGADLEAAVSTSYEAINSINPKDNTQLMLASQMTSVHNFQQKIMHYATNTANTDNIVKLGNLVAKLSNVFVQQVRLMESLQGGGDKKVVFEHVHVHNGAQAVVGTVHTSPPLRG